MDELTINHLARSSRRSSAELKAWQDESRLIMSSHMQWPRRVSALLQRPVFCRLHFFIK